MIELNVNSYDVSSYLAKGALTDGKLDEDELLAAIKDYNSANKDHQITGSLELTYSSSEMELDKSILDLDIDGETMVITNSDNDKLLDDLEKAGISASKTANGELIIYAQTKEELTKVKEILDASEIGYEVEHTDKTEAEIQDYLNNTLMPKYPDGVTKGTGDDYETYVNDSVLQMSFFDEKEGVDVTYDISDPDAIKEFQDWLNGIDPITDASKTVSQSDVEKALLAAGASQEDVDANIDGVMAGLVDSGFLKETKGGFTKTDKWPEDQPEAAAMSKAMQALPEFEEMSSNADIELDTFSNAFVKSLTGIDPVDHEAKEIKELSKDTVETWLRSASNGKLSGSALSSVADTVLEEMEKHGYITEDNGVFTLTDSWPTSTDEIDDDFSGAITTLSKTYLSPIWLGQHGDEFYSNLYGSMSRYND